MESPGHDEKSDKNPMLTPKIAKVVVNSSIGKSGEPLEKAIKIIEELTGQKPCIKKAKKTVREFGIRKKEPIACVVTLRGKKAYEFLAKSLRAVDNQISRRSFDKQGNFSFGIKEHIDIPGTKYSPDLGIIGMDVSVTLERPGYRVKHRHHANSKVGSQHLLTTDEAVSFLKDTLGVEIT
ncbi:50S ribosomal protein L5 [Candidatus Bathyarchaeota archaeon]|nr:50S ribosomal protein L5 [Candidatus Bathyarchaeota archaeon]